MKLLIHHFSCKLHLPYCIYIILYVLYIYSQILVLTVSRVFVIHSLIWNWFLLIFIGIVQIVSPSFGVHDYMTGIYVVRSVTLLKYKR